MITFKESDFLDEFYRELNRRKFEIEKKINLEAIKLINSSPTYQSLKNGELNRLLFLEDVDFIENWISVQTHVYPNKGIVFGFGDGNYRGLIDDSRGSFTTNNGIAVDWLSHLLVGGTAPLFKQAQLVRNQRGIYLMRASTDLVVSPEDSGTINDNFITRAIKPLVEIIPRLL